MSLDPMSIVTTTAVDGSTQDASDAAPPVSSSGSSSGDDILNTPSPPHHTHGASRAAGTYNFARRSGTAVHGIRSAKSDIVNERRRIRRQRQNAQNKGLKMTYGDDVRPARHRPEGQDGSPPCSKKPRLHPASPPGPHLARVLKELRKESIRETSTPPPPSPPSPMTVPDPKLDTTAIAAPTSPVATIPSVHILTRKPPTEPPTEPPTHGALPDPIAEPHQTQLPHDSSPLPPASPIAMPDPQPLVPSLPAPTRSSTVTSTPAPSTTVILTPKPPTYSKPTPSPNPPASSQSVSYRFGPTTLTPKPPTPSPKPPTLTPTPNPPPHPPLTSSSPSKSHPRTIPAPYTKTPLYNPHTYTIIPPNAPIPAGGPAIDESFLLRRNLDHAHSLTASMPPEQREYIRRWVIHTGVRQPEGDAFLPRRWLDFVRRNAAWLAGEGDGEDGGRGGKENGKEDGKGKGKEDGKGKGKEDGKGKGKGKEEKKAIKERGKKRMLECGRHITWFLARGVVDEDVLRETVETVERARREGRAKARARAKGSAGTDGGWGDDDTQSQLRREEGGPLNVTEKRGEVVDVDVDVDGMTAHWNGQPRKSRAGCQVCGLPVIPMGAVFCHDKECRAKCTDRYHDYCIPTAWVQPSKKRRDRRWFCDPCSQRRLLARQKKLDQRKLEQESVSRPEEG